MEIAIENETRAREPGLLVGYAIINDVSVAKAQKPLKKEIMSVVRSVRDKYASTRARPPELSLQILCVS